MTETVFLALGSNLGDRAWNLAAALDRLRAAIDLTARSPVYETAPMYIADQPAFLNMVVGGTTDLEPLALLDRLKAMETEIGRVPAIRNGPRVLDLDILYYGKTVLRSGRLSVPHPRIGERAFVLAPLADIAPDWKGPGETETVVKRLDAVPGRKMVQRSKTTP